MLLLDMIRSGLAEILGPPLKEMGVEGNEWVATVARADSHVAGDIALPCFVFAKAAQMGPAAIAEKLLEHLEISLAADDGSFSWCNGAITAGGYLNVHLDRGWVKNQIDERWGPPTDPTLPPDGTVAASDDADVVIIEHTSANPNGPFHIGRARNAILGDTLVRLQRLAGRRVCAEYYVDDLGKQVGMLAWALDNLTSADVQEVLEADGRSSKVDARWVGKADHERVLWYQVANQLATEQKKGDADHSGTLLARDLPNIGQAVEGLVLGSEEGDDAVLAAFDAAYRPVLKGMLETLGRMGVSFDVFTRESTFLHNGDVGRVVEQLQGSELADTAENGAWFLELANRGVSGESTRFFFQRGDG
ncbi:MAG TPA: arginine--tRNA ligase, partial [Candidatus Poseidoniales archaeon]|nr:arginine--tRNA ligase [Candidatus Poseidoniales archaeon]